MAEQVARARLKLFRHVLVYVGEEAIGTLRKADYRKEYVFRLERDVDADICEADLREIADAMVKLNEGQEL